MGYVGFLLPVVPCEPLLPPVHHSLSPTPPHSHLYLHPQADNPAFPNPNRRLRLQDLADRVADASQDEHELNQLLNEALLERESAQV